MVLIEFSSTRHADLRKGIAHFLREECLLGTYCSYDQIYVRLERPGRYERDR